MNITPFADIFYLDSPHNALPKQQIKMAPRKTTAERVVVEQVKAQNQGLSDRMEDNQTFEDTVIKVEVYESEREITRVLQDYVPNTSEEQRLIRKIDLRLLPILGAIYALQSMDRTGMVCFETALQL
jgi:hypothetical protein